MSRNERLNNMILERTIEYNTTQPQNSTAKESNATSEIESTWKERPKSTWPTHVLTCSTQVITCLSYGTSLLAVTIVNNYAMTCPCKNYAGWPFWCPYRNVGFPEYNPTQGNQLCKVTAKIRLAFHFLERNDCAVFIWEYIKLVIIKDYESAFDAV